MNVRSRDWCYTLNNYTAEEIERIDELQNVCQYSVYGKEVGESGTPHLQAYIYFANARTFSSIKKLLPDRCHIEKTKGTPKDASNYCKKGEQSHAEWHEFKELGPHFGQNADVTEFGELPEKQGKRTDLDNVRDVIRDTGKMSEVVLVAKSTQSVRMAQEIFKYHEVKRDWKPEVIWLHGPTGTGKSALAYEMLGPDCYTTMDTGKWWEGYDAHENVLIDDMRKDFLKFHQLLKLLDRYAYRIECKGGSRQFLAKKIVITSCYSPTEMFDTREDINQLLRRIDEVREIN